MNEKRIKLDNKTCFKSDGTKETGSKIINELERLGGVNSLRFNGDSQVLRFYWITYEGRITCDSFIPEGYTLTELPSEVKLRVGDAVRINPNARLRTAVERDWRSYTYEQHLTHREIQYIFKIEGNLIYIDHKDYEGTNYIVVERENVELVNSTEEKNQMKNRILTPANAQRIISVACSAWKSKLAEKWATNIVLNKDTEISEEFYQEMRSACTAEQNEIFDEIFGKDEQLIKASDLKIGEAMIVQDKTKWCNGIIISRIWSDEDEDEPRYVNMNDRRTTWSGHLDFKGKKVKLTIAHEVLE
jgi:hypothetical protein